MFQLTIKRVAGLLLVILLPTGAIGQGEPGGPPGEASVGVRIYPAPPTETLSSDFTVKANQSDVPVYLAKVSGLSAEERIPFDLKHFTNVAHSSFASFDLQGQAEVVVTCPQPVQSAKVLPSSRGIEPVISGNQITLPVAQPGQLVLEINGDWIHSLQLFINPWETDSPDPKDPKVIYYGPGVHEVENFVVTSGQTVYVAGGAVVRGKYPPGGGSSAPLFQLHGDNIVLRGRGIIDNSLSTAPRTLLEARGTNIRVEGIILRDSWGWTFPIVESEHVVVNNIKIMGYRANSDGIDICNSRDVQISDSYLRTFDDLIVVKSLFNGAAQDITIKHCVLWNEFAHALSLGAELRKPVENILFSDCDIIHDKGREWLLRVYNCDSATVKNVVFDNIRIEEARRLISLWIGKAFWSRDPERGHIETITFSNIHSVKPEVPGPWADLVGWDAEHAIDGVQFNQVQINDQDLRPAEIKQNKFVSGMEVQP